MAAYGTDLGELHLWDVVSGQRLGKWSGHRCVIWSVGFAGMSRAVTGSDDMTALVWDLRPKEKPTKPLWDALVGEDAVEAYRAIWAIAADPKGVVLLRDKIGSAKPVSADQMNRWVADLGADNFAAREMATKDLEVRGRLLELPLQSARKTTQSEEVRTRSTHCWRESNVCGRAKRSSTPGRCWQWSWPRPTRRRSYSPNGQQVHRSPA